MLKASVVIALYNGEATMGEQLDALNAQSHTDFEATVADNGSTDAGPAIVEEHPLRARLVDASGRRGQSYARNVGAATARSEKLLFCDQDDVADPGWVAALADALDAWDIVGGLSGGRTLNGWHVAWRTEPMRPDGVTPLPAAHGSNLAIRREVLDVLGGWPEDYLGSGEDAALCWKAQLKGFTLDYREDAVMHYRYRTDLRSHARQQYEYGRQLALLRARFPGLDHPPVVPMYRSAAWLAVHVNLLSSRHTAGWWLTIAARSLGGVVGARNARLSARAESRDDRR